MGAVRNFLYNSNACTQQDTEVHITKKTHRHGCALVTQHCGSVVAHDHDVGGFVEACRLEVVKQRAQHIIKVFQRSPGLAML
jgi:hypothetical protein